MAQGSVAIAGADEVEGFGGPSAPFGNPTASAQGVEPLALGVGHIGGGGVGAFEFDCETREAEAFEGEGVEDGDVGEAGAKAFALGVLALFGGALGFVGAVVGNEVEGGARKKNRNLGPNPWMDAMNATAKEITTAIVIGTIKTSIRI